jgi:hypothetical protein
LRDLVDEDIELPVLRRDARSLTRELHPQSRLVPVMAAHTVLSGGVTDLGSQVRISASMPDASRRQWAISRRRPCEAGLMFCVAAD